MEDPHAFGTTHVRLTRDSNEETVLDHAYYAVQLAL